MNATPDAGSFLYGDRRAELTGPHKSNVSHGRLVLYRSASYNLMLVVDLCGARSIMNELRFIADQAATLNISIFYNWHTV